MTDKSLNLEFEKIDLNEEFKKLSLKLANPVNIFSIVWKDELVKEFNNFVSKIVNYIGDIFIDRQTYEELLYEIFKNTNLADSFYDEIDINLLKSILDTDLYYKFLKHKYSDLDHFLEQFFSKIKNRKEFKESDEIFEIKNYKNIQNKNIYQKMLNLLKNDITEFKKQLKRLNHEKPKPYQILRYIWLKSKKFRKAVLDDILPLYKSDLTKDYKKFHDILNKLKNILRKPVNLPEQVKQIIDEKLNNFKIDTNAYFELEELKNKLKENYKFQDKDFRTYIKQKFLSPYKNKILDLSLENQLFSQQEWVKIAVIFDTEKLQNLINNLQEKLSKTDDENEKQQIEKKLQTLKVFDKFFMLKDILLQIESKLWYSPWIKPIIKQSLSEKIDLSKPGIKRFKTLLYFVIAQDYKEYKNLYKFFQDTENIFQKDRFDGKVLYTLSMLTFFIIALVFLNVYIGGSIYNTFLFGILFFITMACYTVILFDLKFKLKGVNNIIWILVFSVLILIFLWARFGLTNYLTIFTLLFITWLLAILIFTVVNTYFQNINIGIYKIVKFIFLLMLFAGASQNFNQTFLEKTKQVLSFGMNDKIVNGIFLRHITSKDALSELASNLKVPVDINKGSLMLDVNMKNK